MLQQIKLINEMIGENPDATIRDFLDLLKDIESIEVAAEIALPVYVQGRGTNGRFMPNMLMYVSK
jgi:hypothetical protein